MHVMIAFGILSYNWEDNIATCPLKAKIVELETQSLLGNGSVYMLPQQPTHATIEELLKVVFPVASMVQQAKYWSTYQVDSVSPPPRQGTKSKLVALTLLYLFSRSVLYCYPTTSQAVCLWYHLVVTLVPFSISLFSTILLFYLLGLASVLTSLSISGSL
jgi:hypothetical protein